MAKIKTKNNDSKQVNLNQYEPKEVEQEEIVEPTKDEIIASVQKHWYHDKSMQVIIKESLQDYDLSKYTTSQLVALVSLCILYANETGQINMYGKTREKLKEILLIFEKKGV